MGKLFSFIAIFQAMVPLVASPALGFVYKNTVEDFPSAYLYGLIGLLSIEIVFILVARFLIVKGRKDSVE